MLGEGLRQRVDVGRQEVVRHDAGGLGEPEPREAGQDPTLVRDLGREHDVERRDAVGRDQQHPAIGQVVEVANLAGSNEVISQQHRAPSGWDMEIARRHRVAQAVEPLDDRRDMLQEGRFIEAGVQLTERQLRGDRGVHRQQVAQRRSLVGGPQRRPLHDRVGLLARQPAALHQGDEHSRRRVQPQAAGDVLAHPLGPDHEPLDQAGHPHEHVVEDDRRVGQDDPLGARVADVALVPERLVLERGARVATEQSGQPGDPFGQDRIALVGHRRRALLAGA